MTTAKKPNSWSELFAPAHRGSSVVLATGVALHAVNIFLTTSLLPSAIDEIHGERLYAWSTTVFVVASVISSTLVARTLARGGPARAYVVALLPFVTGSLLCALSPGMEVLLIGRAIQGFGGGLLAGLGYAVIQTALPEHLWVKATALISAMWGVGTVLGPAIGGVFAQIGAWRLAFVVLAVVGAAVALVALRSLPRAAEHTGDSPVPWVSLALLTASTAAISVASLATEPALTTIALVVAAAIVAGFIARERASGVRVLPASTFSTASPLRWIYLTIGVLAVGTVSEAFTPLFGQRLGQLEPVVAGFLGAAVSLGWSVTMIFSAAASRPVTVRRLRTCGPLVLAVGLAATAMLQQPNADALTVSLWFAGLVIAGAGIGLAFPHLVVAAMASTTDAEETGKVGAGVNTVELMAMAAGSAIGGLLVNLGAPSMLASARYLLYGLALVSLLGFFTALKAGRVERSTSINQLVGS
jgi:MFS family permease